VARRRIVPEPQARQRLLVKANFGQERQAIGVFGVGLVWRHIERFGGVTCINANSGKTLGRQRMKEPHRQRSGLKDNTRGVRRPTANDFSNEFGFRWALTAPDLLASRRIEIDVSFKDTSRPINSSKVVLRSMLGPSTTSSASSPSSVDSRFIGGADEFPSSRYQPHDYPMFDTPRAP
jgi:hypothetical protein